MRASQSGSLAPGLTLLPTPAGSSGGHSHGGTTERTAEVIRQMRRTQEEAYRALQVLLYQPWPGCVHILQQPVAAVG